MVSTKFVPALAIAALATLAAAGPVVDPALHRTLRQQGTSNIVVRFDTSAKEALDSVQEAAFASRGDLIDNLVSKLEAHAQESHQHVAALLAQESSDAEFTSSQRFWINNAIVIKDATPALIAKIAALPGVREVREELVLSLPSVSADEKEDAVFHNVTINTDKAEWGVQKIQASDVWAKGFTGQGIVVAGIDSGVRGTHEALKGNFRGDYGWYDPENKAEQPYDRNGHGTHTMGTIAGANGIGVAPGATWMACKGCRDDGCSEEDLLACAQFVLCPTDTQGKNKDCSKAPHVVNNSWGGRRSDPWYQEVIDGWQKAGIIPIFANGNAGPRCTTTGSPADYANVIAVGNTNIQDALSYTSSKGPTKNGLVKPDISAPGEDIRSASNTGDSDYHEDTGTSMAAPHVTGAVALYLNAFPDAKYDTVKAAFLGTTDKEVKALGKCGNTPDNKFPNNNYGYGRLNILRAITAAAKP